MTTHFDPPKRAAVYTLGCKVNQYESAYITQALVGRGYELVPYPGPAEVVVVNTCTVTAKAGAQSRQTLRRAASLNPGAVIVATGCHAQTNPEELAAISGVALVAGNAEKPAIADMIASGRVGPGSGLKMVGAIHQRSGFDHLPITELTGRTRAYLKVQDGCNSFCTFCAVPYARGRSRSLDQSVVLEEFRRLGAAGFREVVLTGIHLGVYGHDLTPQTDLVTLLQAAVAMEPTFRLRLSSLEPTEVTLELLQLMAESDYICPNLHIPLQSGHDDILARMGRPYGAAAFARMLEEVFRYLPRAGVGLDVMVGFPGEDDRAFEATHALISSFPIAYLHVFPFSPRPGTAAAKFGGRVTGQVAADRAERLRQLGLAKRLEFYTRHIGQVVAVLVESKPDPETGLLHGFASNYLPVLLQHLPPDRINHIVSARITGVVNNQPMGAVVG
ncbi:MAG: tRNA (N(6)-L-threonylcarbamoyladenosine(37)-C(2))-methylthiotransferase MtaB [Deltaproteobacteria bacterium]|nr:tRNA (N(6)-L-threonylcarbamoyladenosine(37)-C(2))-methylthiotransferase MtaB [Deltaproteobacteria bacterium]